MKKTFSPKKSAFSLIELSIVLIVIGLLVAGVTGGASLIKSSELRSVMSEARGYSVAVSGFFSQFNALPGDFSTSLGTPANGATALTGGTGDNDDTIDYCNSCSSTAGTLTGSESTIAWYHLKQSGAVDSVITYASAGTAQAAQTNFPASKIKAAGWVFDYNTTSEQNVVVLTGSLAAAASGATPVNAGTATALAAGVITPADGLSVDSKIDDGVANTGKVRGIGSKCSSSGTYTVTSGDKDCALSYQIDVNS